jgi:putative tryptophan/tyrosine transport system substrate-binding protein
MRRREFIAGLGGAAVWPLAARAQQGERVRRIGLLVFGAEDNQQARANIAALRDGLAKLGWVEGHILQMDLRFGAADVGRMRAYAAELVSLSPDAIVTSTGTATRALQQQTQTTPIVIAGAGDVFANGLVKSLARPEGNITGITNLFYSTGSC